MAERAEQRVVPESLENEFSRENIDAYARVCLDIGVQLVGMTRSYFEKPVSAGKTKAILLPSRGALPIFVGALLALHETGQKDLDVSRFLAGVEIPNFFVFEKLRKIQEEIGAHGIRGIAKHKLPIVLFPFTADIDFSKLGVERNSSEEDQIIWGIREFCSKAVLEFYKKPRTRNGKEFQRFLKFLETVEGRSARIGFYQNLPQLEEIITIDTVISGRASSAIVPVFAESGLPYKSLLVVDENGQKLKPQFRDIFYRYRNNVMRYDMPRILTEDRGAALEGVVAVVFPQLILKSFRKGKFISAGDWFDLTRRDQPYRETFNSFLDLLIASYRGEGVNFENQKRSFLRTVTDKQVLRHTNETYQSVTPQTIKSLIDTIQETSSHVVQIFLRESAIQQLLNRIINNS